MSSKFIRGPEVRTGTNVVTASGNVACVNESVVIVNKTVGQATTVTLPSILFAGQTIWVKDGKGDAGTNRITVVPDGVTATAIDGVARHVIGENYGQRSFIWNGTQWNTFIGAPADYGTLQSITGLTVIEMGSGGFHKTVLVFDAVSISTLDNGTAGAAGGSKVYTFPQGQIAIMGVSQDWSLLTADGTGLTSTAALEIGLGTTVATSAMASLTGTAEDVVTGKTLTLSTSLSALHIFDSSISLKNVDGSATAKDAYLNVACSVATSAANGTLVMTGTVTITWASVGKASA